jgi:uracil-DNA glycosylase family 4
VSELEALAKEISECTRCLLHRARTKAVPGEGPANAELMFIGEAPGFHEDQQGRPFVGAAGQYLEELLRMIGFKRTQVFIANVIKCRPPGNREPQPEEIEACKPYLDRQLELIRPRFVVTLGRFSMARAFPTARISSVHGQPRKIDGVIYYPMYHPAAALHQPSLRSVLEEDMRRIPELLRQVSQIEDSPPPVEAEQLKLF